MHCGDVKEFVEELYYGSELYVVFNDVKYFIQGWCSQSKEQKKGYHHLELHILSKDEGLIPQWEIDCEKSEDCVNAFLDLECWSGKKFYDVEQDMIWVDE